MARGSLRAVKTATASDGPGIWGREKNGPEDLLTGRMMARVGIPQVGAMCVSCVCCC